MNKKNFRENSLSSPLRYGKSEWIKSVENKRGQEMSTSTIILIVLGLIVLVILAIGFMFGWKTLAPWLSSESNVNNIAQQCSLACSVNSNYDYCSKTFTLRDEKKNEIQGATCNILSGVAEFKSKWGIELCPEAQCEKFECEKLSEKILKDLVINNNQIPSAKVSPTKDANFPTTDFYYYNLNNLANDLDQTNVACYIVFPKDSSVIPEKKFILK